ncbi:hypothetical protein GGR53DRAFT_153782 [Hypoxylon sp. FL1150]|nr:hypothetical protein GGR53DRAFT_153782 [Hypoxylon sp. FL1150]
MWKRLRLRTRADSKAECSSIPSSVEPTDSPSPLSIFETKPSLSETISAHHYKSQQNVEPKIPPQSFSLQSSAGHQTQRSQGRRDDPLGLIVLHAPAERSVDILFIHGLGGTSLRTWCHGRELEYLWPQLWLPEDPDLSAARILTFGYNAHFSSRREHVSLTIGDFANDLLFRMKYGERGPERLGQVPLIVVAHSMGGLVFKKAFIHGHANEEFRGIISSIKAVLFLATPHRGTDLAQTLNKVLTSSVFGHSPKDYVSELARRSPTVDELNESFRHHASKLRIFSFYETLSTNVGPMSFPIVEKHSALLGYPNEIQQPLNANHHDVCKFTNTSDPNYISVLGALRSIVGTVKTCKGIKETTDDSAEEDLKHVTRLLGISGPPEEDIAECRSVRKIGTCQQFLQGDEFRSWVNEGSHPILWVHAPPGSGKSTLCSAMIDHLQEAGHHCSYFFFKHNSLPKKSIGTMLRSLAYQTALSVPSYRRALVDLAQSGVRLTYSDPLVIWKQVYLSLLSTFELEVMYWVIDGIDESESSRQVIEFVSATSGFRSPLRILLTSRPLPPITRYFQVAKQKVPVHSLALQSTEDIRLFITEEIEYLPSDETFKTETTRHILERAQGNFLWANLVVQRILRCHRQEQVERVLEEAPDSMDALYSRMLNVVSDLDSPEDKSMARILFSWAMYAKAPLTIDELTATYFTEFNSVLDINHTIGQVCGQLVVVDTHGRVSLVHQSARDYLKKYTFPSFSLVPEIVHEDLLCKCLRTLCDKTLRNQINSLKFPPLLPYAATSWSFHLEGCAADSDKVINMLNKFFSGPFPFPWIHYLAMSGHLAELSAVSRTLPTIIRQRKDYETNETFEVNRSTDLSLLESWAVDLLKLSAKFGSYLLQDPQLIYKCIPALSPLSSKLHQEYSKSPSVTLSISGLANDTWDDCLARVSPSTSRALCLAASSLYVAVASDMPNRTITLWDTNLFAEFQSLNTGEHTHALAFNSSGSLLACYGLSQTKIWKLNTTYSLVQTVENPYLERALEFKFDEQDSLMVVTDLRRVYRLTNGDTSGDVPGNSLHWIQLDSRLMVEPHIPEGMFIGTPSSVSFNSDCTQIAVSYRNFPLSIWNIDPPKMIARLKQRPRQGKRTTISHTGTNKVVWHPSDMQVIGIYGEIIRWNPTDDAYQEVEGRTGVVPHKTQCSPNGLVFITSDVEGTIKIYDVARMRLIYRLTSEDTINAICFSPSSVRFYDLRGSYCNIWEPNYLAQLADIALGQVSDADSMSDSHSSDIKSTRDTPISLPTSESRVDAKPGIAAVATCRKTGQHIAYANHDGAIELFDPIANSRHVIARAPFGLGTEFLAWNPSQDRLAFSFYNGGSLTIKEIVARTANQEQLQINNLYGEQKSPAGCGRIRQLLFDTTGNHLFVYRTTRSQVLSLSSGEVTAEHDTPEGESAQWLQHPLRPDVLICISTRSVSVFTWQLHEERSMPLEVPLGPSESFEIDALYQSHCPRFILLRTTKLELNRYQDDVLLLPTAAIYDNNFQVDSTSLKPMALPESITRAVAHPLGILADGRLVFLDSNLWVCTSQLGGTVEAITRHFFIPRDWVTRSDLRLCQLLQDGTILCPSKGEVAIIQNDIVSEW